MSQIDLREYVIYSSGSWVDNDDTKATAFLSNRLTLTHGNDEVTLTGPLRIKVTWYAENITTDSTGNGDFHRHPVYSYVLEIPPGHNWNYRYDPGKFGGGVFGNNHFYEMSIEPAVCEIPASISPRDTDIPCDVGVANIPNLGTFFPSPCEPCTPGASIGLPPGTAPTLGIPPAKGGCVRPRFFNGMFITSEDMETMLRWTRLKQQMQNRAMGQGVVWGLNVERDGRHIRVHPGYAVDCCGHDLVVTTPYCVEIDALLRDPAAVSDCDGQDPRRMHLLLEYQECPEEPRPVHGDPCSPEVSRCEMSRIRETVRLRLVPPRDYRPEGPLNNFLREIEAIVQEIPWLDSLFPDSGTESVESVPLEAPFEIEIGATALEGDDWSDPSDAESVVHWESIRPSRTAAETSESVIGETYPFSVEGEEYVIGSNNIRIRLIADPDRIFLGGAIRDTQTGQLVGVSFPTDTIEGVIQPSSPSWEKVAGNGWQLAATYSIDELRVGTRVASEHGSLTVISTTIDIHAFMYRFNENQRTVNATLTAQPVQMHVEAVGPTPWPCFSEACSGGEDPLFPAPPPWLYGDPLRPTNWRSVALTIVYRFLLWHLRNYREGMPQPSVEEAWNAAGQLLRPFLNAFYNGTENRPLENVIDALRRLLCAWCESFLYPGPQCAGEPHGVVIGCVSIAGGDIASIDPWGGRRYVLHAPLVSHWGEQLGITAPDVLASRVMAMVCCLGGLRPPAGVNHAAIAFLPQGTLGTFHRASEVGAVRVVSLDFPEFVESAVRSLVRPPAVGPETRFVRYDLAGSPGISFLAPDDTGEASTTGAIRPDRERERVSISRYVDESTEEIPPLLEEAAIELSTATLDSIPIRIREENPLRERLLNARILTAGSVLRYAPSEIYARIAESREPRAATEVINENRRLAGEVAHLVTRSISRFCKDNNVVSPDELASDENRGDFVDTVVKELTASEEVPDIPKALMDAVVKRTLRRLSSRRE